MGSSGLSVQPSVPTPPPVAAPPKPAPNVVITNTPTKSTATHSKYVEFVDQVTSAPSKDNAQLIARIAALKANGCDIERLLTAALGISAEGGEFMEIVKKITFQGKPWDEANLDHLKIELGDVMWYVAQACMALDTSFDEIIEMNVEKLKARYPGGDFDVHYSENRKEGDL